MAGRDYHPRHHPLQNLSIQTLLHDKQRLTTSHETLKQEVSAAEHDVRILASTTASVKAEREAQVREFYDRRFRLETELRAIDGIPSELDRVRRDVIEMRKDRECMLEKLRDIDSDFEKTNLELQQLECLKAEIDVVKMDIRRGRAAVDYERTVRTKNSEISEVMEKQMIALSQEAQKLRSELAEAENRAKAAAAEAAANAQSAVTASSSDFGYGYGHAMQHGGPNHVYGGNPVPDLHAVYQGNVEAHLQYGMGVPHGPPGMGFGPHGPPGMGVVPHGPPGVGVGSYGPPGAGVKPHDPPDVGVGPQAPPGPPGVGVGSLGPPSAHAVQRQHLHN